MKQVRHRESEKRGGRVPARRHPVKILDFDYNGNLLYEIERHGIKNQQYAQMPVQGKLDLGGAGSYRDGFLY